MCPRSFLFRSLPLIFALFSSIELPAAEAPPDISAPPLYCPVKKEAAARAFRHGNELYQKKKMKEALEEYLKALDQEPQFCDALERIGTIYQKAGKTDEAIIWHQKAIEANMRDTPAHVQLGADFNLEERNREAAAEYQMAIDLEPENPEGYYGLGSVYLTIGKYRESIPPFSRAEKIYRETKSPYLHQTRFSIGLAYFFTNDCPTALSFLEPVYPEFQNDKNMNYALGLCYVRAKQIDKGKPYLEKASSYGLEPADQVLDMIENGEIK
jgi:tetratricopeptide (TPR) repeat protein